MPIIFLFVVSCSRQYSLEELARKKQDEIVEMDRVYFRDILGVFNYNPTPDYLDRNRESALANARLWLSNNLIDTTDFLNYVLPNQVNNAVSENWREKVIKKMSEIKFPDRKITQEALIDYCNQVNELLKKDNVYGKPDGDESFYRYVDYGQKKGTCIAMTDYANYTFRALGIPVTTDFVPIWGNLNSSGHAWNRLLLKKGSLGFMGAESNMGDYQPFVIAKNESGKVSTYKIPPKVYRVSRYSKDSFDLFGKRVVDVTEEYVDVRDIDLESVQGDKFDTYLSTYNKGRYIISAIGEKENNRIFFRKMAIGLVYFPVKLDRARPIPTSYPIICNDNGYTLMKPDLNRLITIPIKYLASLAQEQHNILGKYGYGFLETHNIHNIETICPKPVGGKVYELFYWDFGWKKHGESMILVNNLTFNNVPSNGIYIVKEKGTAFKEYRPFAYALGKVNWF